MSSILKLALWLFETFYCSFEGSQLKGTLLLLRPLVMHCNASYLALNMVLAGIGSNATRTMVLQGCVMPGKKRLTCERWSADLGG